MVITQPQLARLEQDRESIEQHLERMFAPGASPGGRVFDCMRYAVLGRAQRVRPLLTLRLSRLARSAAPALTMNAACSVELLHCASLIVDDLPCMDDAQERRNRPAAHIAFGEATAVLAAFALVALGARSLVECESSAAEKQALLDFQIRYLSVLDLSGLINGQSMDLELSGEERERHRRKMTQLKTVPLFELAARAGCLFAALSPQQERCLVDFGRRYGFAFQTADDLEDGEAFELDTLERELKEARSCLRTFGPEVEELEDLLLYLHAKGANGRPAAVAGAVEQR